MNILLVTNSNKDIENHFSKEVIEYLIFKKQKIYSDDGTIANIENVYSVDDKILSKIDFAIVIGGDGTVLTYASKYAKYKFPFVAINLGRVGALSMIEKDSYKEYLDKILNKDYYVEERIGLECKVNFKDKKDKMEFIGYNDIILHRGLSMKLLPIETSVNDSKKDVIYADGIVIATPSGSSAYNVSAGGPLLSINSKSYVVTPICPQSRIFTSLVVSDDDKISLCVSNKLSLNEKEITLSGDGFYNCFISPGDEIVIKKSKVKLKMIRFNEKYLMYQSAHKAVASLEKKGE